MMTLDRPSLRSLFSMAARVLLPAAVVAAAVLTAACSTTEGFGKDMKHLGGDIEGSAERNK